MLPIAVSERVHSPNRGMKGNNYMGIKWCLSSLRVIILSALAAGLAACSAIQPIPIGFSAELTGKQSEASINMRNGVRMAVEEINAAGGIAGRMINLMIEDDGGIPQGAADADAKLIQQHAVAIIGHLTSNQTLAGYEVTEKNKTVLFSPTAATSYLTGKKDDFFRTFPTTDYLGREFARYIFSQRGLSKISIIYDLDNDSYTVPFAGAFEAALTQLGGKVPNTVTYRSAQTPDLARLVDELIAANAQGVFMISSSTFAPLIAQKIRLQNWNVPLFAAPWSQGDVLIQNGGKAVNELELILPYDLNDQSGKLTAFKKSFLSRYNESPPFSAMFGYETTQILCEALKKTGGNAGGLSEALSKIGSFEGLVGPIQLDEFGDVIRTLYIVQIQNGEFVTKLRLSPEK